MTGAAHPVQPGACRARKSSGSARPQLTDRDEIGARPDQDVRLPVLDIAQILPGAVAPDDPVTGFQARPDNSRDRRRGCELPRRWDALRIAPLGRRDLPDIVFPPRYAPPLGGS